LVPLQREVAKLGGLAWQRFDDNENALSSQIDRTTIAAELNAVALIAGGDF